MRSRTAPPVVMGLLAGLLTSTAVIVLSATGLLPVSVSTPLLLVAGGLAAGLAAPVRPTTGALLGAVTGIFAAVLLTIVYIVQMASVLGPYYSSPPFALTAGVSIIMFTPLNTAAGAVGAAVRARLTAPQPGRREGFGGWTPERRQWTGIAVGALAILSFMVMWWFAGNVVWRLTGLPDSAPLVLIFSFAGGVAAGFLSAGGVCAGILSGLLSGLFSLASFALLLIAQASMVAVHGVPEVLWPIVIAYMAFWVLPAVALGGALGASFRKPTGRSVIPSESDP